MINFTTQFLIWQPFASCKHRCRDCYVRDSSFKQHRSFAHWTILASLVHGSLKVENEVVLSVDSKLKEGYTRQEKTFLSMVVNAPKVNKDINLHLAVRDMETLQHIMRETRLIGPDFGNKNLARISLSYIPEKGITTPGVPLNWNYVVDPEKTADFHLQNIGENIQWVDTLHLILKKAPLGNHQPFHYWRRFREVMNGCRASKDIHPKLYIDDCYLIQAGKKTQTCTAKEKIHIWPNGQVSVCPYDSFGVSSKWRKEAEFIESFKSLGGDNPCQFCLSK